jgi:glycosyltransferase involved in cell wall biosynthesis
MENGILVKVGCIDELADAMEFVLNNPKTAEIMGQNAKKIINDLDPDVIINQWQKYINNHILYNR